VVIHDVMTAKMARVPERKKFRTFSLCGSFRREGGMRRVLEMIVQAYIVRKTIVDFLDLVLAVKVQVCILAQLTTDIPPSILDS